MGGFTATGDKKESSEFGVCMSVVRIIKENVDTLSDDQSLVEKIHQDLEERLKSTPEVVAAELLLIDALEKDLKAAPFEWVKDLTEEEEEQGVRNFNAVLTFAEGCMWFGGRFFASGVCDYYETGFSDKQIKHFLGIEDEDFKGWAESSNS